jgi:hypothetical protein
MNKLFSNIEQWICMIKHNSNARALECSDLQPLGRWMALAFNHLGD